MSVYPPLRYNRVCADVHKGAYPRPVNFPFLKRLELKIIVSLTPNPITEESDPLLYNFLQGEGITNIHIPMSKESKKKFQFPSYEEMINILKIIINVDNSPIYIHCLNGGIVTSLVVACLRKIQLWNTIAIFREFSMFTDGVVSLQNRTYIESFRTRLEELKGNEQFLWSGLSIDVVSRHPTLNR